jgi:hypothetical protein
MKGPELSLVAIAAALLQSQPASAAPTLYIYFQDILKVYATNNDTVAYTCDVSVRYSFNNLMNGRWSGTAVFGFSVLPPGVVDAQEESFGVVLDPQIVSEVSSCA